MSTLNTTLEGQDIYVEYTYTPGEDEVTYYGDGSGYPGSPAEVDITHIEGWDGDIDTVIEYILNIEEE